VSDLIFAEENMKFLFALFAIVSFQATGCRKSDPDQPASGNGFKPIDEGLLMGTWVCTFRVGREVNEQGHFTWEFRNDRTLVQDYPADESNRDHTFGWALGTYENRESLLLLDTAPGPSGVGQEWDFEQSVIRLDGDELSLWIPARTSEGRLDYPGHKHSQFRRK
jgi:hypothetical protein